jgi:hypothetical protein
MAEYDGPNRHHHHEHQEGRQKPPRPPSQELAHPDPAVPDVLVLEDGRDQEAAQNKEDAGSEHAAFEQPLGRVMEEDDRRDGESPQAVQGRRGRQARGAGLAGAIS